MSEKLNPGDALDALFPEQKNMDYLSSEAMDVRVVRMLLRLVDELLERRKFNLAVKKVLAGVDTGSDYCSDSDDEEPSESETAPNNKG